MIKQFTNDPVTTWEPEMPAHWTGPIQRWKVCPSTHCERSGECRAPHECSAAKDLTRASVREKLFPESEGVRAADGCPVGPGWSNWTPCPICGALGPWFENGECVNEERN